MLRATTACTFSTSQLPKVVRGWCVLYILTWKCASRHNGVHFSTSQLPKVVRHWCVLYIFTWKCASRHNGMHFFDISTSKSGPTMWCFDPCLNFHYRKGELVLALKRLARGCFNIEKCSCARLFIGDPCETIL